MDDEPEKYQTHFSEYIKRGIEADNMEELYKKVHAAIRADPTAVKSTKEPPKAHKRWALIRSLIVSSYYHRAFVLACSLVLTMRSMLCFRYNLKKLTYDERKARLVERLNALNSTADDDEDEEDDD